MLYAAYDLGHSSFWKLWERHFSAYCQIYLATIAEWPFLLQELPHLLPAEPPIWPFRSGALSKSEVGLWIVISCCFFCVPFMPQCFPPVIYVCEIQWYLGTTLSSLKRCNIVRAQKVQYKYILNKQMKQAPKLFIQTTEPQRSFSESRMEKHMGSTKREFENGSYNFQMSTWQGLKDSI